MKESEWRFTCLDALPERLVRIVQLDTHELPIVTCFVDAQRWYAMTTTRGLATAIGSEVQSSIWSRGTTTTRPHLHFAIGFPRGLVVADRRALSYPARGSSSGLSFAIAARLGRPIYEGKLYRFNSYMLPC